MLDIYIIGCGGIGGYVIERLPMALSSLSLDMMERGGLPIQKHLQEEGVNGIPLVADSLTLVDGDTFSPRNSMRQGEGLGVKVQQRMKQLRSGVLMHTWLRNLRLRGVHGYVTPENVRQIILKETEEGYKDLHMGSGAKENSRITSALLDNGEEEAAKRLSTTVIFMCVDNLKTRYELSKYAETLDNVLLLNGGNEKTTGHVTVYEKQEGVPFDPALYELYPEVSPDVDKRPDEISCQDISPKHDQTALTNAIIADIMMCRFCSWVRNGLWTDVRGQRIRTNECLIDIDGPSVVGLNHRLA